MPNHQEKKVEKLLRSLSKKEENKKCFDCGQKGVQYVCIDFLTFVCTSCSGMHREFAHRIKGISLGTWNEEEVMELKKKGGNKRAAKVWLGNYKSKDYSQPDPTEKSRIREFMRLKYEEKRFFKSKKDRKKKKDIDEDSEDEAEENVEIETSIEEKPKKKSKKKVLNLETYHFREFIIGQMFTIVNYITRCDNY